jgi:hypothetical protein
MTRTPKFDYQHIAEDARNLLGAWDAEVEQASEDARFPPEVRARLKVSAANALANIQVIHERISDDQDAQFQARLIALIEGSEPPWIRLRKLYTLIDEMNSFNGENVACRRGCAHCCHIPVAMTPTEAEMLGSAIGRQPKGNVAAVRDPGYYDSLPYGYHTPCPFLKNRECSIYEHRPLACRKLVNADIDDLLCRLIEPQPPIPFLDRTIFDLASAAIGASRLSLPESADIRAYFP